MAFQKLVPLRRTCAFDNLTFSRRHAERMECVVEKCPVPANPEVPPSTATDNPQFVYLRFANSARSLCSFRRASDDISEYGRSLHGRLSFFVSVSFLIILVWTETKL